MKNTCAASILRLTFSASKRAPWIPEEGWWDAIRSALGVLGLQQADFRLTKGPGGRVEAEIPCDDNEASYDWAKMLAGRRGKPGLLAPLGVLIDFRGIPRPPGSGGVNVKACLRLLSSYGVTWLAYRVGLRMLRNGTEYHPSKHHDHIGRDPVCWAMIAIVICSGGKWAGVLARAVAHLIGRRAPKSALARAAAWMKAHGILDVKAAGRKGIQLTLVGKFREPIYKKPHYTYRLVNGRRKLVPRSPTCPDGQPAATGMVAPSMPPPVEMVAPDPWEDLDDWPIPSLTIEGPASGMVSPIAVEGPEEHPLPPLEIQGPAPAGMVAGLSGSVTNVPTAAVPEMPPMADLWAQADGGEEEPDPYLEEYEDWLRGIGPQPYWC